MTPALPGLQEVLSVSELTARVKGQLERAFPLVFVEGEISNYSPHSSGHHYFALKDASAQIRCVMFRFSARSLTFVPREGLKVRAAGRISVFERSGSYQLYVEVLEPAGLGELHQAFERLKARLEREGLFDPARKRPLPFLPRAIGVVTSPTGAAIRDILRVLRRRFPAVDVVLYPARVQGPGAADEIAAGIAHFSQSRTVDVLIVGRGGGSVEDLWAFNEEVVARAIQAATVPVISAVGHEIDFTISDFVADRRAATPSNAAELAVPEEAELRARIAAAERAVRHAAGARVEEARLRLESARRSDLFFPLRRVARAAEETDRLQERLAEIVSRRIEERRRAAGERAARLAHLALMHLERSTGRLAVLAARLQGHDPQAILARGYSVCRRSADGRVVRSFREVAEGGRVQVQLAEGGFHAQVTERDFP